MSRCCFPRSSPDSPTSPPSPSTNSVTTTPASPVFEGEKVNMHDVGHGKGYGGVAADDIRKRCGRTPHGRWWTASSPASRACLKAPARCSTTPWCSISPTAAKPTMRTASSFHSSSSPAATRCLNIARQLHPPAVLGSGKPQDAWQLLYHPAQRLRQPCQALRCLRHGPQRRPVGADRRSLDVRRIRGRASSPKPLRVRISSAPKVRSIPAWGKAPGFRL